MPLKAETFLPGQAAFSEEQQLQLVNFDSWYRWGLMQIIISVVVLCSILVSSCQLVTFDKISNYWIHDTLSFVQLIAPLHEPLVIRSLLLALSAEHPEERLTQFPESLIIPLTMLPCLAMIFLSCKHHLMSRRLSRWLQVKYPINKKC